MFSSSNHMPFELPEGKIEFEKIFQKSVENAIKYADFAIGKFLNWQKRGVLKYSFCSYFWS